MKGPTLFITKHPEWGLLQSMSDGFKLTIQLEGLQRSGQFSGKVDTSRFAILRRREPSAGEVTTDLYETAGEIDIVPLEGQELPLA